MARIRRVKGLSHLSLEEVEHALAFVQPGLHLNETPDAVIANGEYVVTDGPHADGPIKCFSITIEFPKTYPLDEPRVFETDGAIERCIDRHMYNNGRCCTCVWEEWLAQAKDTSVKSFCDGPLRDFFIGQVIFEQTGQWPFGERAHGVEGIVEAAAAVLEREVDQAAALSYLQVLSAPVVKGHWPCPCGSNEKLRKCCRDDVMLLRERIDRIDADRLRRKLIDVTKLETRAGT